MRITAKGWAPQQARACGFCFYRIVCITKTHTGDDRRPPQPTAYFTAPPGAILSTTQVGIRGLLSFTRNEVHPEVPFFCSDFRARRSYLVPFFFLLFFSFYCSFLFLFLLLLLILFLSFFFFSFFLFLFSFLSLSSFFLFLFVPFVPDRSFSFLFVPSFLPSSRSDNKPSTVEHALCRVSVCLLCGAASQKLVGSCYQAWLCFPALPSCDVLSGSVRGDVEQTVHDTGKWVAFGRFG